MTRDKGDPLRASPMSPIGHDDAPNTGFQAPWQAQAFAIMVALRDAGRIDPQEWAQELSIQRSGAGEGDAHRDPEWHYFTDWLRALERIVIRKGMTDGENLERYRRAWERATHRTPHGAPLVLQPQDIEPDSIDAGTPP